MNFAFQMQGTEIKDNPFIQNNQALGKGDGEMGCCDLVRGPGDQQVWRGGRKIKELPLRTAVKICQRWKQMNIRYEPMENSHYFLF